MHDPTNRPPCRACGRSLLPRESGELCASCLLGAGLTPVPPPRVAFQAPSIESLAARFPHLDVLELVGQGGMGAVYRCRQPRLDRLVALKVLRPDRCGAEDGAFTERFLREARVLAGLDHPGIVRLIDFGVDGELHWLLMDYVDGSSLREVMDAGRLPVSEALALVPAVCEALQYAHDRGVVHRDIKPENLLLDSTERVRIADFGLARLDDDGEGERLTLTGEVFGTPRYMAPEQLEGARAVDHRADVYAVGAVLYELLTGEPPLGRFDAPSERIAGLADHVDDAVLRALDREPGRRFQRVSELGAALSADDSPAGSTAPGAAGAPGVPVAPDETPEHEQVLWMLLCLGAIVFSALGVTVADAPWVLVSLLLPGCAIGDVMARRQPKKGHVAMAVGMAIGAMGILAAAMLSSSEGVTDRTGWCFLGLAAFGMGIGAGYHQVRHEEAEAERAEASE